MWLFHFVSQVSVCNHAKARFSGLVTKGGQNKPQIWNPRPQFAYSLYNFYRATMTIKGTLLLNNFIVKRSVEKNRPVLAKISTVFAIINVKNFHGSLTTVVRAQNDTTKTANITYIIFDRTLV